jgi:hypothetical protein
MNGITFLLWTLIAIEYLTLTHDHGLFNTYFLLSLSNILFFWVCQNKRMQKACTLSSVLTLLTLSSVLVYHTTERRQRLKLLIKIIVVFMLLSINYDV